MADATKTPNGAPKVVRKTGVKRANKPRSFYMAYKGQLEGEPTFVFDKDELVDAMLSDRTLQVKRITVPVGKKRSDGTDPQPAPSA